MTKTATKSIALLLGLAVIGSACGSSNTEVAHAAGPVASIDDHRVGQLSLW